jgi:hypothetical protein
MAEGSREEVSARREGEAPPSESGVETLREVAPRVEGEAGSSGGQVVGPSGSGGVHVQAPSSRKREKIGRRVVRPTRNQQPLKKGNFRILDDDEDVE